MKLKTNNFNNANIKIIFLFFLLLVSFSRSPFLFLEGRFLAEEATTFFKYSYFNEWYKTLFFIDNIAGYNYVAANINAIIADLVPLEKAPLATIYGSLGILFFIFYFILNTNSYLFINIFDKYLACLVLLLSPPFVAEVWLNSINTQVYLGILTIIILFINFEEKKFLNKCSPYILIFNGLSGIYSCVITPFFLLKYFLLRKKNDLINFFTLFFCCIFQGSIVVYSKLNNLVWPHSMSPFDINEVISFFYNAIFKAIFGREIIIQIIDFFGTKNSIMIFIFFSILSIFSIYFIYKKKLIKFNFVFYFLLMIFITMGVFVMYGNDGVSTGGRYSVINGTVLIFILINLKNLLQSIKLKNFFSIILIFNLIVGAYEFFPKNDYDKKLIKCIECPKWSNEIKRWNELENYKIKLWPYTKPNFEDQKWMLDLNNPNLRTLEQYINPEKLLNKL